MFELSIFELFTLETGYKNAFYPRGLMSGLFLYAIHTVDKLHDLVLGKNRLITGLFLYPVSSVLV